MRIFVFAALFFHSVLSIAYEPAEGNVSSYFGPYLYKTNFEGSSTGASSPSFGGFGLIVIGDVNDKGSLEIGMFYLNKIYFRQQAGAYMAEQTPLTHITMGYRRWFTNYLSGSLTFFSAYSMGTPQIVHSDFPAGQEIDTSARDVTEYGFDLALQTDIWNFGNFTLVADARYSWSVTPKESENADHYGLLLGLRYVVQKKEADPSP